MPAHAARAPEVVERVRGPAERERAEAGEEQAEPDDERGRGAADRMTEGALRWATWYLGGAAALVTLVTWRACAS
jgi:hypothetical protein